VTRRVSVFVAGPIPSELCTVTTLHNIVLDDNKLSGWYRMRDASASTDMAKLSARMNVNRKCRLQDESPLK